MILVFKIFRLLYYQGLFGNRPYVVRPGVHSFFSVSQQGFHSFMLKSPQRCGEEKFQSKTLCPFFNTSNSSGS